MTLESYPVWPFEPNWTSPLTESLDWLTDVLASPTGSEQRRSLRANPRRIYAYEVLAHGAERAFFENMLAAYGSSRWWMPLWHDVTFTGQAVIGTTTIPVTLPADHHFTVGSAAVLMGESAFDNELVEIAAITSTGITVASALDRSWAPGTRLFPAVAVQLTDQPELDALTDRTSVADVQFRSAGESVPLAAEWTGGTFNGFPVLTLEPDWKDIPKLGTERDLDEIDNKVGVPKTYDRPGFGFATAQFTFVLNGRDDHFAFYRLMQAMRGKCQPCYVPTWTEDFVLAAAPVAGQSTMLVQRCGFTLSGGPRTSRDTIMLELVDGSRIYRTITNCAISGTNEVLVLNQPWSEAIPVSNVLRICFIRLMRLNHDTIEIEHLTDLDGTATVDLTFRFAPNSRVVADGF